MRHGLVRLTIGIISLAFAATQASSGERLGHRAYSPPAQSIAPVVLAGYRTPARGSDDRAAIMDAARGPIAQELGSTVIFVVSTLRSDGEWAYLDATPANPDGSPLDWDATPFAEEQAEGIMEGNVLVLLRDEGYGWSVVDYAIGPTDVYWLNWVDQYGLPEALFRGN